MIPSILNNPLDSLDLSTPPESTQATLATYYPQIQNHWDSATQVVATTGEIVSRTFSILTFPPLESKLVKIDVADGDTEWGAPFYYSVISYFDETSFSSHYREEEPFKTWEKTTTRFRQQALYKHSVIDTLTWNRPTILNPFNPNPDPRNPAPLPTPFTLTFNVGRGLGASIVTDGVAIVRLKSSPVDPGVVVENPSLVILDKPIVSVEYPNPTAFLPSSLTVSLFGAFYYSTYAPANSFQEEETLTLLHPYGTPYQDRLKPPGQPDLLDSFWNTNYASLPPFQVVNRSATPFFL